MAIVNHMIYILRSMIIVYYRYVYMAARNRYQ